jgi:O-antigen ligase
MGLRAEIHRTTSSLLFFLLSMALSASGKRIGVQSCLFFISICPTFSAQFQAFTGYGRIQPEVDIGLAIVCGTYLGLCINHLGTRSATPLMLTPWPAGLLLIFITLSCCLSIHRNLFQTQSPLAFAGLVTSVSHYALLDWFNDYRPIRDWLAYAMSILLISIIIPTLQAFPQPGRIVAAPIAFGILLSALIGVIQSKTGIGLLDWQVVFRRDSLGSMALGLQPDIHAFAAQMMLGSLGLLGFLIKEKSIYLRLLAFALLIPITSLGIVLSKSKASLAISLVFFSFLIICWLARCRLSRARLAIFFCAILSMSLIALALTPLVWSELGNLIANSDGPVSFNTFNEWLSFRPEIYFSAVLMFLQFPFLGVGQGNFYRLSTDYDFSQSKFLAITQNGENAHNYFFQTISETGIIGSVIFLVFLLYPFFKIENQKNLLPATIALGTMCLGNIFSHSFLVRENLLIASAFIAILYFYSDQNSHNSLLHRSLPSNIVWVQWSKYRRGLVLGTVVMATTMAITEIQNSLRTKPFLQDIQCYRRETITADGWSSGSYTKVLPEAAIGIEFIIEMGHPDLVRRPVKVTLELKDLRTTR